jgi:hypothetical protein
VIDATHVAARWAKPGGAGSSRFIFTRLRGVEEFEILLVDRHALAEGDRCGLGAADQMHPAPGLVGGVVFFDDRLVMLEGVHLGEIVVAHDLGKTRDEGLRVPD